MELNTLLQYKPYSTARTEKRALYAGLLTELTQFHREHCPEYGRLLDALGCPAHMECTVESAPMLPVSLFKELELRSIPEGEVFKTITSSGTTGQRVSRIFLDGATSACQQQALCQIMSDFLGERRLPFLVLDSRQVLRNRAMFSARGAGILGFSIFGTRPCYALDEHMELDLDGVRAFLEEHQGETIFLFGFTFIIWKHVVRALEERGERLDIPNGILVHGGGWKKLAGEAVSPGEFKARVAAATGVERVSNYYGMAEQTGCIYMECPQGHLHASLWSDIVVRRGRDYRPCEPGEEGVLQVLSPLPRSYPGHSLLTEDLGVLLGEDDCPCGRKGKYFKVTGRPFLGRLDDIGQPGIDLIQTIAEMFGNYPDIHTEIIAASVRNPIHITDCALAGAHIATVPYKVLEQMIHHPLTDAGIEKFQKDYVAVFGK